MSSALTFMGSPGEMLQKAQAFKELGALVESGFLPSGFTNVKQVAVVCWQADALGVHPMVMLQNCTIIHQRPYFSWRLKWGLIASRYPEAEMETVKQTEELCAVRARKSPQSPWQSVTFTREQCRKNPVTAKNPLYEQDWLDMSYKACVHRICDRLAPEVLLGLPSGELNEVDDVPTNAEPGPKPGASVAEVLGAAAGPEMAATQGNSREGGADSGSRPDAPVEAAAPPAVRDWTKECFALIDSLWKPKPKEAPTTRRRVCELILTELRGEKVKLTTSIAPSDAHDILEYLVNKYPNGTLERETEDNGPQSSRGNDGEAGAPTADATSAPTSSVDGGGATEAAPGTDAPPAAPSMSMSDMAAEGGGEEEYEVPLGEGPDVDPVAAAADAAERERFDADGRVLTIFAIAKAAQKTHPGVPVVKEAPPGSGKWYLVHFDVMKARGRTNGRLIQSDGEQKIDSDECRALVVLLREHGLYEAADRR